MNSIQLPHEVPWTGKKRRDPALFICHNQIEIVEDDLNDPDQRHKRESMVGTVMPGRWYNLKRIRLVLPAVWLVAVLSAAAQDLASPDVEIRIAAVRKLAAGGQAPTELIPALVKGLSDPYWDVREGASRVLAKAGRDAVAPLLKALASDDYYAQVWSAKALGGLGPAALTPEAVGGLIANVAIQSVDEQRQLHAAWALAKLGPKDTVFAEPLERVYVAATDPVVKAYLVTALVGAGGGGGAETIARAVKVLTADDSAGQLLRAVGAPAVDALIAGLQTSDKRQAAELIGVLGGIGPAAAKAIPALIKEVETPRDPWIGSFAVNALAKIGPDDERVKAAFEKAVNGQPGPAADAARKALAGPQKTAVQEKQ
jgi:HEAT repeat protein